jgi:predicted amidohydrolase
MEASGDEVTSYRALALQVTCHSVNQLPNREQARARMRETIERLRRQIPASLAWIGKDARLVVLPEYFLTGFPMGETIEGWSEKACLEPGGPEYEALGRMAQENKIFLAGNAYELDAHFPGLYFQTSFIIDVAGNVALRYRRLNSMFAPTPHDVWDRYLDIYGLEGVFPVARTEIGNLAAVASEEILFPEIARCLAMRGAEILVHSSCEIGSPRPTPKGIAKIARAIENLVYLVSANTGGMEGIDIPGGSTDGGSMIVDYRGQVLAEAGTGESIVAYAEIDVAALRRYRRRPGMDNLLSRQRFELYAESYRQFHFYPANTLLDQQAPRSHFVHTQRETIERLIQEGII